MRAKTILSAALALIVYSALAQGFVKMEFPECVVVNRVFHPNITVNFTGDTNYSKYRVVATFCEKVTPTIIEHVARKNLTLNQTAYETGECFYDYALYNSTGKLQYLSKVKNFTIEPKPTSKITTLKHSPQTQLGKTQTMTIRIDKDETCGSFEGFINFTQKGNCRFPGNVTSYAVDFVFGKAWSTHTLAITCQKTPGYCEFNMSLRDSKHVLQDFRNFSIKCWPLPEISLSFEKNVWTKKGQTVVLPVVLKNTGETRLRNITLVLEGPLGVEYETTPQTLPLLWENEEQEFNITLTSFLEPGEHVFNLTAVSDETTYGEKLVLGVLNETSTGTSTQTGTETFSQTQEPTETVSETLTQETPATQAPGQSDAAINFFLLAFFTLAAGWVVFSAMK